MLQGTILKSLIFFVTYEWAQEAEVLHYTKLERFARYKHSTYRSHSVTKEKNGDVYYLYVCGFKTGFVESFSTDVVSFLLPTSTAINIIQSNGDHFQRWEGWRVWDRIHKTSFSS
jgi:hypothetical protein